MIDIFSPIVNHSKLHPDFEKVRTLPGCEAARRLMNEVYQHYQDKDGNFVEQFQTKGFDQRTFELFLFAYFSEEGYDIDQTKEAPDYLVKRGSTKVAIEATTANTSSIRKKGLDNFQKDYYRKMRHELPVVFGSPLYSKLNHTHKGKKYWELPYCADIPFVIAIQTFHEEGSLHYSDAGLAAFLYGLWHSATRDDHGNLEIISQKIYKHERYKKNPIDSGFFYWENCENISAVIFCNSGTGPKFNRMGYQKGYCTNQRTRMLRFGECYDSDENADQPLIFNYDVSNPPVPETWGQGLSVFINPRAKNPLPQDFFVGAAQHYLHDGRLVADVPYFHPFTSFTMIIETDKPIEVTPITQSEFESYNPPRNKDQAMIGEEIEWYYHAANKKIGTIILDRIDRDYTVVTLRTNTNGLCTFDQVETSLDNIEMARIKIMNILNLI